ncbi:hypothetical protein ACFL54_08105 [Planctomycetota bacterium]
MMIFRLKIHIILIAAMALVGTGACPVCFFMESPCVMHGIQINVDISDSNLNAAHAPCCSSRTSDNSDDESKPDESNSCKCTQINLDIDSGVAAQQLAELSTACIQKDVFSGIFDASALNDVNVSRRLSSSCRDNPSPIPAPPIFLAVSSFLI